MGHARLSGTTGAMAARARTRCGKRGSALGRRGRSGCNTHGRGNGVRAFARLYAALDETTKTNAKVDAMAEYFRIAAPADAAWAVYFLTGNRPKRLTGVRKLAAWAMELADVPEWLFSECY